MAAEGARQRIFRAPLTEASMLRVIADVLPRANGYVQPDVGSLLAEARQFGIETVGQFRRLLLRHRLALRDFDRSALGDLAYLESIAADHGDEEVRTILRKQRCFGWEALVRTAMEFEFGDAYAEFAQRRDGL